MIYVNIIIARTQVGIRTLTPRYMFTLLLPNNGSWTLSIGQHTCMVIVLGVQKSGNLLLSST